MNSETTVDTERAYGLVNYIGAWKGKQQHAAFAVKTRIMPESESHRGEPGAGHQSASSDIAVLQTWASAVRRVGSPADMWCAYHIMMNAIKSILETASIEVAFDVISMVRPGFCSL
jgi:hypothetical protein